MPFLPAISGHWRAPSGPTARLHVARFGRLEDRRQIAFVLSRELIELCGWQGGERFVLSLGIGEDLGAFQLVRVTKAGAGMKLIPSSQARGFRVRFNLPPEIHGIRPADYLDRLRLPATLDFTIADGAMTLQADMSDAAAALASFSPFGVVKGGAA